MSAGFRSQSSVMRLSILRSSTTGLIHFPTPEILVRSDPEEDRMRLNLTDEQVDALRAVLDLSLTRPELRDRKR